MPRSSSLQAIALALQVPIGHLVLPVHKLHAVRFRRQAGAVALVTLMLGFIFPPLWILTSLFLLAALFGRPRKREYWP